MNTTAYILPATVTMLIVVISALCFIKKTDVKLIRRIAMLLVSLMFVPILILFIKMIVSGGTEEIVWAFNSVEAAFIQQVSEETTPITVIFAVDMFAVWMLLVATIIALTGVCIGHYIKTRHKTFYILSLTAYVTSIIVILSQTAWLSLAGLMLFAVILFFMSGIWSRADSYTFVTRFIFIQSIGFSFIAFSLFIIQYIVTPSDQALILQQLYSYIESYIYLSNSDIGYRNTAFVSMMLGVIFLLPLVGFHRSVIDLFKHVHYPVLVFVAGLYLPLIAYVVKQFLYTFLIDYIASIQPYLIWACVLQIMFMAISLWKVDEIKTWAGYVILANVPIIYILLVGGELVTVSFSLLAIISFMLMTTLLLAVLSALNERQKKHTLGELKGLFLSTPYLASSIVITFLAISGLPVFSHFFALFHTFYAVYDLSSISYVVCLISVFLIAINIFLHMSKLFNRSVIPSTYALADLRFSEIVPYIVLVSLLFVLGIYPSVFLERIEVYTEVMLDWLYKFNDVIIWNTDFYWSLLKGDSIESKLQYGIAALSLITLLVSMWLGSRQNQKMLSFVLWSASHFASVALSIFVVSIDVFEVSLWKQLMLYSGSVILIYIGTHFLLSRHMYRTSYEDAVHYEGLYYKSRKMHVLFVCLLLTIVGLPFSALSFIRYELIAQLFIQRYILLAIVTLFSFCFMLRPIWYWLASITFPVINEGLLNKQEQIEDWTWTKLEKRLVIGSISINTIMMFIYILI